MGLTAKTKKLLIGQSSIDSKDLQGITQAEDNNGLQSTQQTGIPEEVKAKVSRQSDEFPGRHRR